MTYVPLHVHSEYSLLNGLSQTHQISKRISDIETNVCALTDQSNFKSMFSNNIHINDEYYLCYEKEK